MPLIPAEGVYAANAWLDDGSSWPAALNIGPNPTFGEQTKKVEAHLIGFAGTLYGQGIALDLIARLRATRRFGSIDELKAQLAVDTQLAASLVARG
jgi:riboflavin kinase/FMN adenylyltransferase